MNFIKKELFFFVFGIIATFIYFKNQPEDFRKKVNHIVHETVKELSNAYDLQVDGYAMEMKYKLKTVFVDFVAYKPISQEESRKILINCLITLVNVFNKNEDLHPFFDNYPFTVSNLRMQIFFKNKENEEKNLALVSAYGPNLYFCNKNSKDSHQMLSYAETFDEALKLVNHKQTEELAN